MAHLTLRIDDHTRDLLDGLARARAVTTSDLIRDLIAQALGRDDYDRPRDDTTPPSLSALDRRRLAMQHEILAILTADESEDDQGWEVQYHREMIEILERGYTAEYYRTFQMIHPEMSVRECDLVHDILGMFTNVEWSVEQLGDADRTSLGESVKYALKFRGFDFNDTQEARLASYAHYLVKDDRYRQLADRFDAKHERGNSHMPLLATYQRMLSVWRPISSQKLAKLGGPEGYALRVEELREILAASPYPKD